VPAVLVPNKYNLYPTDDPFLAGPVILVPLTLITEFSYFKVYFVFTVYVD